MEIRIGENIKRLRIKKGVTQEQLSEILNVSSVAISKWERGETMPDISLLPKLAFYFQTSIDDLMNYDACEVELQITEFIRKHTEAAQNYQNDLCKELSAAAYTNYPNDYRVMLIYMWDIIGGCADNDDALIRENKAELNSICDRILKGCNDMVIRNDAYAIKGKILKAEGNAKEALALYQKELPDWYQTSGQKSEQLFEKGTEEFAFLLRQNINELCRLVLNKKSKEFWFCTDGTLAEKTEEAVSFCETLKQLEPFFPDGSLPELIAYFAGDFVSKLCCSDADPSLIDRFNAYR